MSSAETIFEMVSAEDLWHGVFMRFLSEPDSKALELCRPLRGSNGAVCWRRSALVIPAGRIDTPNAVPAIVSAYLNEWNFNAILLLSNSSIWTDLLPRNNARFRAINLSDQSDISTEDITAFLDPDLSEEEIREYLDAYSREDVGDQAGHDDFTDDGFITFLDAVISSADTLSRLVFPPHSSESHKTSSVSKRIARHYDPEDGYLEITLDFNYLAESFGLYNTAVRQLRRLRDEDPEAPAFWRAAAEVTRSLAEFSVRILWARSLGSASNDVLNLLPRLRGDYLEMSLSRILVDPSITRRELVFDLIRVLGLAGKTMQAALMQLATMHAVTVAVPAIRLLGYFRVEQSHGLLLTLASDQRSVIRHAADSALNELSSPRGAGGRSLKDLPPIPTGPPPEAPP